MITTVYQYGTHSRTRLPEEATEQLRLAHQMRNALVEAELSHEGAVKALWSAYPEIADIEAQLEEAEARAAELVERVRAEHSRDRTVNTRTESAKALTAARHIVRDLRRARREGIGEAYVILKPDIEELKDAHKQAIVAIRQDFADRGLYWATYNAVLDDHRTSINNIKAARRSGRAAAIKFRRWDGGGTLTIQIQRKAGDPPRSPLLLESGEGKWRNVFTINASGDPQEWAKLTDARRKAAGLQDGRATWTIGRNKTFEIPVVIHRPIPPEADICETQLTVRKIGPRQEITVAVTVNLPDPTPREGFPAAMHFGWRSRGEGGVRVAAWASKQPLRVLDALKDVALTYDGGRRGEIVLPQAWLDYAQYPSELRRIRDLARDPVARKLADWLDGHPQEGLTGTEVRRWRSPGRFARIANNWREQPPEGGAEIAKLLGAWRHQDKHLWSWEANQRVKGTRRRDDAWRRVAAWLVAQCGVAIIDDTNLVGLRARPDAAETDSTLPAVAAQAARARAALAAPGRLREAIKQTARREGVTVDPRDIKRLTRTHRECGHYAKDPDPQYAASVMVICPGCGKAYDQDYNVALLMLDGKGKKESN